MNTFISFNFDFSWLLTIGSYIFLAVGLYTMAKRRGIRNPWLAWIPVANMWLLGCLSDQYQYVALGRQKNKRKMLLTLEIVVLVLSIVVVAIFAVWFFKLLSFFLPSFTPELLTELAAMTEDEAAQWAMNLVENSPEATAYVMDSIGLILGGAGLALVLGGLAIWLAVVQYMAYNDLFRSADPRTAGMFLALGIVLSFFGLGILLSIFVFINREKDQGMPPRQDEVVPPPPVWTPPTPPTEPWA